MHGKSSPKFIVNQEILILRWDIFANVCMYEMFNVGEIVVCSM